MNDQVIIETLQSKKRDKALVRLYRYYPKVEKLILSKGGNKPDAQDIFQEALIVFCRRIEEPNFELSSGIDTYLYSVCHFLWRNELKKRNKRPSSEIVIELHAEAELELEELVRKEERIKVAMSVVVDLGNRCLELLKLFYYQSLKMTEIAKKMDFRSEKIARNQKYKCLERAKLKLKEKLA